MHPAAVFASSWSCAVSRWRYGILGRDVTAASLRRVAALCIVLVLTACDSQATLPPSGGPTASGGPASNAPGETVGPASSSGPGGSGVPSVGDPDAIPDPPVAALSDPFAIGQALYDPAQMTQAVVSLLALMGVGVYQDDGTPIDTAAVTKPTDPWLFASEVWALIDMGTEDVIDAPDDGPTYRLADLHAALQGTLDPDVSLDEFISAYADSYASHPDDLGPSVMLGQPIDASTPLTRTQLWLLYMDGFVELAADSSAVVRQGPVAAGGRPRSGTARANLPPLAQPQSLTVDQWRELRAHFMTIVSTIDFGLDGGSAHEGHGGLGQAVQITARLRAGRAFRSPVSGAVILQAGPGPLDGLQLTWRSRNVAIYNDHGTLAAAIPGTTSTDASGRSQIAYTPKREVANGQGVVTTDAADISVTANARDLLVRAYRIDDQSVLGFLMASTLLGTRTERSFTTIDWHAAGIQVTIENIYDVTVSANTGGLVAFAHRKGKDTFSGTLTKRSDGTYRGVLTGQTEATSQMEFVAGVAGDRCEDSTNDAQLLTVVARRRDAVPLDPNLDILVSGSAGPDDFVLTFYPKVAPGNPGRCQGTIAYVGPGPDGQVMSGVYASYSDSRFTAPSLGGFRIHLPKVGETLKYEDWRLVPGNLPPDVEGVDSTFIITVVRQPGS